jgi:hypothetical protein
MLMGHPPHLIARGGENGPQGCCEGLTPVQGPMVVQACVAYDSEGEEAWAEALATVQKMAQARPHAFPRVTGHPCAVRGTTRLRARPMVDRPMVVVGLRAMGEGVGSGNAWRPTFPLRDAERCDRGGAPMLQDCQRDWRGWRVLVCLGAAVPHAQQRWTAWRGRRATAPRPPSWSGCAVAACACTGQPLTARTRVARVSLHWGRQVTGRIPMGRRGDATLQQRETPLRCPLLESRRRGQGGGVQQPWPPAHHPPPCEGPHRALLDDRPGPVRAPGNQLAHARRAGHTVQALQSVVAPFGHATASRPPRGHVTPSGQCHGRKESAAFRSSYRYGMRCFIGVLPWDVSNHLLPHTAWVKLCERSATDERRKKSAPILSS